MRVSSRIITENLSIPAAGVIVLFFGSVLSPVIVPFLIIFFLWLSILKLRQSHKIGFKALGALSASLCAAIVVGVPFAIRSTEERLSLLDNDHLSAINLVQHFAKGVPFLEPWNTDFAVQVMPRALGALEGHSVAVIQSVLGNGVLIRAEALVNVHVLVAILASIVSCASVGTLMGTFFDRSSAMPTRITYAVVVLLSVVIALSMLFGPIGLETIFGASNFLFAFALVTYSFSIADELTGRWFQLALLSLGVAMLWPLLLPIQFLGVLGMWQVFRALTPNSRPHRGRLAGNLMALICGVLISLPFCAPIYLQRSFTSINDGATSDVDWLYGGTVSGIVLLPLVLAILSTLFGPIPKVILRALVALVGLLALWPLIVIVLPILYNRVNDGYYAGRLSYAAGIEATCITVSVLTVFLLRSKRRDRIGLSPIFLGMTIAAGCFAIGTLYYPGNPPFWHASERSLQAFPASDELFRRFDRNFEPFFSGPAVFAAVRFSGNAHEPVFPWTLECKKPGAPYYAALWRLALRGELLDQARDLDWSIGACETPGWFRIRAPQGIQPKLVAISAP